MKKGLSLPNLTVGFQSSSHCFVNPYFLGKQKCFKSHVQSLGFSCSEYPSPQERQHQRFAHVLQPRTDTSASFSEGTRDSAPPVAARPTPATAPALRLCGHRQVTVTSRAIT